MSDHMHCCCMCGKLERWNKNWSHYSSIRESEDGDPIAKFCCDECAKKAGPKCEAITDEMKKNAALLEKQANDLTTNSLTGWEAASKLRQQVIAMGGTPIV